MRSRRLRWGGRRRRRGLAIPASRSRRRRAERLMAMASCSHEQLGQVAVVDAGIAAAGQDQDLLAQWVGQAPWAGPTTVGVDQPRRPVALEPNFEPPDLALAELQQRRRLSDGDLADQQLRQDPGPSLLDAAHGDRLLHVGRLTNSLSS
jgi:hypothetical protein